MFDEERLFCGLQPFAYIAGLAGLMDLLYLIFEFQYYGVSGIAAWPWPVLLGESSVLVACLVKFYGAAKGRSGWLKRGAREFAPNAQFMTAKKKTGVRNGDEGTRTSKALA